MTARNSLNFKPLLLSQLNEHLRRLRRRCLSLNFWLVLTTDVALLITAYFLSRYLRFDALHLTQGTNHYIAVLLVILTVKLPIFYLFGLYNGMWRYTGFRDLQRIVGAALVSSSVIITIMTWSTASTAIRAGCSSWTRCSPSCSSAAAGPRSAWPCTAAPCGGRTGSSASSGCW